MTCSHVIAIDIDPIKIALARHNARIYGVEDRIEFIVGDYFKIIPTLTAANVIFLSPPWGGPDYLQKSKNNKGNVIFSIQKFGFITLDFYNLDALFDLKTMIPVDGMEVFNAALKITENIAYLLPKNTNVDQVCTSK